MSNLVYIHYLLDFSASRIPLRSDFTKFQKDEIEISILKKPT